MGAGASSKSRYAPKASTTCSRCTQGVGSSTHYLGNRPLCNRCGELSEKGALYICTVCEEIHRHPRKDGACIRVCSSCESKMRSPSKPWKPCTECGEVRMIGEAPAARGRCAACWLRGGSSHGLSISLPDEDSSPGSRVPSIASPSPASSTPVASTTAPPSPASSIPLGSPHSSSADAAPRFRPHDNQRRQRPVRALKWLIAPFATTSGHASCHIAPELAEG